MSKNPKHRPKNTKRIESMIHWFDVVLSDARIIDDRDYEDFYTEDLPPVPQNMTLDHWFSLMIKGEETSVSDDEQELLEWIDSIQDLKKHFANSPRSNKMAAYELAAKLFNKQLSIDQSHNERLTENPTTGCALQRALNRAISKK
jgi:hypothetical protein